MSLTYDKQKDTHICSTHGDVGYNTGWVPCWSGCQDGYFDEYEDNPINCSPGEMSLCEECKGKGGWIVCGKCNRDNPDVEW